MDCEVQGMLGKNEHKLKVLRNGVENRVLKMGC
jgi:hypothetical protein